MFHICYFGAAKKKGVRVTTSDDPMEARTVLLK